MNCFREKTLRPPASLCFSARWLLQRVGLRVKRVGLGVEVKEGEEVSEEEEKAQASEEGEKAQAERLARAGPLKRRKTNRAALAS